jgi:tetratricopeptide (TPR) repeat protein
MDEDRKRKLAADCWKRGSEAMLKQNWDYAIDMFRQSIKMCPENLMYRQSLRGCEERKYNNNGSGASMSGMKLMGTRTSIKKLRFQKKWPDIEQAAEDGLAVNPWDPQLNADLGDALREQQFIEIATWAYERAVKGDENNKDYNRALGNLYEERGNFDNAVKCFERLVKLDPLDGVSRNKVTALQAKKVTVRGGYEDAENTQDVRASKMSRSADEADAPGQSVEADLQRAIRKDPSNKENYLKLAAFFKREGRLEECEEQLKKALEVSGGDIGVREVYEDAELDRMRQVVARAKDEAAKHADKPELKKRGAELAQELKQREIDVFSRRVERYPGDMRMKFELSQRYISDKRFDLAIPLLQQARSDPRLKGEALVLLGKCFISEKKYPLARKQFEMAREDVKYEDRPDEFKELHYFLGRVCEQTGDKESAISSYQEVLAVDYNYKDTQDRSEKLESG